MLAFALRSAKRGWTLHRQAQGRGSVRLFSAPFKSATSSEKQRLDAIRKQGESKRRAYSLEQRERQSRPEVQYILQVSDDAAQGEAGKGSAGEEDPKQLSKAVQAAAPAEPATAGDQGGEEKASGSPPGAGPSGRLHRRQRDAGPARGGPAVHEV